jgi:hypothetical protein
MIIKNEVVAGIHHSRSSDVELMLLRFMSSIHVVLTGDVDLHRFYSESSQQTSNAAQE